MIHKMTQLSEFADGADYRSAPYFRQWFKAGKKRVFVQVFDITFGYELVSVSDLYKNLFSSYFFWPMYAYHRLIKMCDTDASGVIYFSHVPQIALESFEDFFQSQKVHLGTFLREGDFLLPIVHTEANYMGPIFLGDQVMVSLSLKSLGETSFTLATSFHKEQLVASCEIVHVVQSKKTKKSISIPDNLKKLIELI